MTTFGMSRREVLTRIGGGFGSLALATLLQEKSRASSVARSNPLAPRAPHFAPKAKRLIFLFMNGGPSHVDTFDPKPALKQYNGRPLPASFTGGRGTQRPCMGSPFRFPKHGQSGIPVSELFPE